MLTACGNNNNADDKASEPAKTEEKAEETTTEEKAEEKPEEEAEKPAEEETTEDTANQADYDFSVISREEGSGTRGAFIELVGLEEEAADGSKEDKTTVDAVVQNSTNGVMTSVAQDPNAIGYISLDSLNDTVKPVKVEGVEATEENIVNGSYKISRPFNLAYKEEKLNDISKDFLAYCCLLYTSDAADE